MATGYIVTGRGDLDSLFMPRTSSPAATTGFLSNGGVDLSQRFEPRGATTAIANTNFRNSSGTDLAQIFKDINAAPVLVTVSMTAGTGAGTNAGWENTASGYSGLAGQAMTGTPEWTKTSQSYRLDELTKSASGGFVSFLMRVSHASSTPADADTVWSFISATGVWAGGGGSTKKTLSRSTRGSSVTGTAPGGRPSRNWQYSWAASDSSRWEFVPGNTYTIELG